MWSEKDRCRVEVEEVSEEEFRTDEESKEN